MILYIKVVTEELCQDQEYTVQSMVQKTFSVMKKVQSKETS